LIDSQSNICVLVSRLFLLEIFRVPLPKPTKDEEQSEFVSRCISFEKKANPNTPDEQVQAMCYQAWRDRNKKK